MPELSAQSLAADGIRRFEEAGNVFSGQQLKQDRAKGLDLFQPEENSMPETRRNIFGISYI